MTDYYIGEALTAAGVFYDLDSAVRTDLTVNAVAYDTDGTTVLSSGTASEVGSLYTYALAANLNDAAGIYQIVLTPTTSTNITPLTRTFAFVVAGYRPTADSSGRVTVGTNADKTGYSLADDAITAAKIASDAVTELQSGLATSSALSTLSGYVDTEVAAIKAKTDSLTFTTPGVVDASATISGTVDANVTQIAGSATAATNLRYSALTMKAGTVQAGSSATSIVTNLTESTTDLFKTRIILFYSGGAAYGAGEITAYNGTSKTLTVSGLPVTPSTSDTFVIL